MQAATSVQFLRNAGKGPVDYTLSEHEQAPADVRARDGLAYFASRARALGIASQAALCLAHVALCGLSAAVTILAVLLVCYSLCFCPATYLHTLLLSAYEQCVLLFKKSTKRHLSYRSWLKHY